VIGDAVYVLIQREIKRKLAEVPIPFVLHSSDNGLGLNPSVLILIGLLVSPVYGRTPTR